LRDSFGFQELAEQDFARMKWILRLSCHDLSLSVVINNLYIEGVSGSPPKNNSPLIIDPDGMEVFLLAHEAFQPVSRRGPQVFKLTRIVQVKQFPPCYPT
jgi:hypothetical protein